MKAKAIGNRVLVRLQKLEKKETYEGSCIVRADLTPTRHQLEKEAVYRGYVMDIGPDAYSEYKGPWCKVGDLVQISKYSGSLVDEIYDSEDIYRMINDIDVQAVLIEDK